MMQNIPSFEIIAPVPSGRFLTKDYIDREVSRGGCGR
jgi:hypothetical protein